jgi:hypothetical protein
VNSSHWRGKDSIKQNLILFLSVFHFSAERHVSEYIRIHKSNTDIYKMICHVRFRDCVMNLSYIFYCISYGILCIVLCTVYCIRFNVWSRHRWTTTKGRFHTLSANTGNESLDSNPG